MDQKSQINLDNFISKNYLESLNQVIAATQKTHDALVNNSALKSFIKDASKIQEMVSSATKMLEPTFKSLALQQDLIKAVSSRESYIISSPTLHLATVKDKKYKKQEMEDIVQLAIEKTIKLERENNNTLNNKNDTHKKFQSKLSWTDIIIKFKDRHNVQIVAGRDDCVANFKEMGFENSKNLKPNLQWIFFEALANNNGSISWKNNNANDLIKKKKQLLAKGLKNYFNIDEDPFYRYSKQKGYQLKLNISPESESVNKHLSKIKVKDELEDDLGISESYNEQTNR
jgi:hypothetical protein